MLADDELIPESVNFMQRSRDEQQFRGLVKNGRRASCIDLLLVGRSNTLLGFTAL